MAENFNLIFGSQAPETASWSDADYQTGWNTVGSTPPTAEQFDALQNRSDKKSQELNNRLSPLERKAREQGRQAGTAYTVGAAVTVDRLPADWLLVCTKAGKSGTAAITLPNPLIDGATITDGTIKWKLRKVATNGGLGYRQPSTTYTVGAIAYHSALPTGWYLECTTGGISYSGELAISSPSIGGTVTDGTVVWTVCKDIGTGNAPIYAGFNQKQTFTSSGSFTAHVTGIYKITLQGAGGGGSGAGTDNLGNHSSGSGGASGEKREFYISLTAGDSYNFTIGAGGQGGSAGSSSAGTGGQGATGGNTNINVKGNTYNAQGGHGGDNFNNKWHWGPASNYGASGTIGTFAGANATGGTGGSVGGGGGAGGAGGSISWDGNYGSGNAGGDGYIMFEWLDTSLL